MYHYVHSDETANGKAVCVTHGRLFEIAPPFSELDLVRLTFVILENGYVTAAHTSVAMTRSGP